MINRKTRALVFIISALVLSGLIISYFYYKNVNESVDPRVVEARTLYDKYNGYAQTNAFDSVFLLMDQIESLYAAIAHYEKSYEIGVLYNNRAASFLTMALYRDSTVWKTGKDSLIGLAETAVLRSIAIYQQWLDEFQNKDPEDIENMISGDFLTGLENYESKSRSMFLENRIKEIQASQKETERRLSVSYTNLGIIYRNRLQYDSAAISYQKAIDLWDRNLTAENNLNVLLGRPLKKRNFIQKLFPPDRD